MEKLGIMRGKDPSGKEFITIKYGELVPSFFFEGTRKDVLKHFKESIGNNSIRSIFSLSRQRLVLKDNFFISAAENPRSGDLVFVASLMKAFLEVNGYDKLGWSHRIKPTFFKHKIPGDKAQKAPLMKVWFVKNGK